jgi:hypothetical protein
MIIITLGLSSGTTGSLEGGATIYFINIKARQENKKF